MQTLLLFLTAKLLNRKVGIVLYTRGVREFELTTFNHQVLTNHTGSNHILEFDIRFGRHCQA